MSDLNETIRDLESCVPAPEQGLGEEVLLFVSRLTPLISVDLLIRDDAGRTLLTWRHDQFYGPGWHIPGGIIRYKERAEDRIHAVARLELYAEVTCDPVPLAVLELVEAEVKTRGHMISLLYRCRLLTALDEVRRFVPDAPQANQWQWYEACPADLLPQQAAYRRFIGKDASLSGAAFLTL